MVEGQHCGNVKSFENDIKKFLLKNCEIISKFLEKYFFLRHTIYVPKESISHDLCDVYLNSKSLFADKVDKSK